MSPRRVADPDRASEIVASAARLFREKGVKAVSIDDIVQDVGIAKGTFYLYFKSKDGLLEKLAEALVQQMVLAVEEAGRKEGAAIDRFVAAVLAMQSIDRSQHYLADALNHPENSALHDLANMALVREVAPVLAVIVEQGKQDGAFDVEDARSTLEFLLAGQAALLGGGRFNWSPEEHAARLRATFVIIERSLGIQPGKLVERFTALGIGRHEPPA
ncbi:TetR/AcrR family transcriptional regulator [Shinella sedimenti]|jgi:AcrR family transcriptional regulator|uniref:TetR/AcrR family transcriptional regulator n=1 Tax=Shinella sedimenti TaxID=2919913 RepID=A0ABT0CJ74_9HYPH|nr:TetR/AcrR family transcriptional regulator [Shinella sedimenti]MCJ8148658.1 TetR/AcrR family transcriptional regulator [Shinella sedimenti]